MNNIKAKSKYLLGGIILGIFINKSINIIKKDKVKNKEILLNEELDGEEYLSFGVVSQPARVYIGNSSYN